MNKQLWVAELGSNHNGDIARALGLVDAAAAARFDAVKVQAFRADRLFREADKRAEIKQYELSLATLAVLCEVAHTKGLLFGVSVFDVTTLAEVIATVPVDFLKIASYSLIDLKLIRAVAQTGKKMMIGTGMGTGEEIEAAWREAFEQGAKPTMLHCVSNYPTAYDQMNLKAMENLSENRGLSDHSRSLAVVLRAVHRYRARVIELHFDLNGRGREAKHSWLSDDVHYAMALVNMGFEADGSGQKPHPCERSERQWRADPSDGLRPIKDNL